MTSLRSRLTPLRADGSLNVLSVDAMSTSYKDTLNLPKTDFPMKANLVTREPELLKHWEETDIYGQIQAAREGRASLRAARRPALRQRRRAHGHRAQQDP